MIGGPLRSRIVSFRRFDLNQIFIAHPRSRAVIVRNNRLDTALHTETHVVLYLGRISVDPVLGSFTYAQHVLPGIVAMFNYMYLTNIDTNGGNFTGKNPYLRM